MLLVRFLGALPARYRVPAEIYIEGGGRVIDLPKRVAISVGNPELARLLRRDIRQRAVLVLINGVEISVTGFEKSELPKSGTVEIIPVLHGG